MENVTSKNLKFDFSGLIPAIVQDANTMAVLWQLGVEFIQGYFVNAPEEVVLG